MAVKDLIPRLRELSRSQKLEVIQFLTRELEMAEMPLKQGATYTIWSPIASSGEAQKLATLLNNEKN